MEVLLHRATQLGGWRSRQIHEAILSAFQLTPENYTLTQLRYDLRKLKAHAINCRPLPGNTPQNATAATFAAASILKRPNDEQDPELAENLLHQAIAADSKFADAYLQLAVLDQQQMRWHDSTELLEKVIVLRPESSEAHYRLARAYSHLGRREQAQQEIALQQKYAQEAKDIQHPAQKGDHISCHVTVSSELHAKERSWGEQVSRQASCVQSQICP